MQHMDRDNQVEANYGEGWSEAKNARRCTLIDREIDGTISPTEAAELDSLQREMLQYRRRVAPLPLVEARALHQELIAHCEESNKTANKSMGTTE